MDLTVGLSGSGANRIVSGTAEDEINQALAGVGAAGGGTVSLLPGTFVLAAGVWIFDDNVTLKGAGAGQSILQAGPTYSGTSSIIQAQDVDNLTIQDLTVDGHTNDILTNGIMAVKCSTGTVTGCEVLLSENHNYGIWLVLSQDMQVLDNHIDGFVPTAGQEGIESWSCDDVLISGNTLENLGGAGINLGSLPTPTYGDIEGGNSNIRVFDNVVDHSYVGVSVGLAGPRSLSQVEIKGNTFSEIAYGVRLLVLERMGGAPDSESATVEHPQSLYDVDISNNQINLVSQSGVGILLDNTSSPGIASFSNINASDNVISNAPGQIFGVYDFDNFTLDDNIITGVAQQVSGSPYDDVIIGSNLANVFSGGDGADTFKFDLAGFTPGSGVVDRVLDYNRGNGGIFDPAEGDSFDLSALLSAGSGQPVANLVRVLESPGGTGAILQIDQNGSVNGAQWTTIVQIDAVHAGDTIKIVFNASQPAATLTVPGNHAPVVTAPQPSVTTVEAKSLAVSSLFSASDGDGDALTYYLYDANAAAGSGRFVVNGVTVAAQTIYQLTAAQFAQATFVAGAAGTADDIYVQAFDGQAYSGWNTSVHVTATVNHAPLVTASQPSVTAVEAKSLAVSSLFSASDSDGDALTYYLYDASAAAGSGHFVVNGVTVAAQTIYKLTAAQFSQATFVAGAAGTADVIYVQAFDGRAYSGWNTSVHVTATVNHAPTVSLPSSGVVNATPAQSIAVSSLFSGSDVDGDTLSYFLYDASASASSGHFVVNGMTVAAQTIYSLTAAQLAQATFVTGADGTADDIYVQAFDGKAYSGWNASVHVAANAPNHAPTVNLPSGATVGASAGQTLQLSSLFGGSDVDGDTLSYFVYDASSAANSGHVEIGGNVVAAQTITAMTAAQLAQAIFVAGAAGTTDDIYVQAFDGKAYSGWNASVHVAANAPNHAPTVNLPSGATVGASAGQTLQLSSLFGGSDIDGDTLRYFVYDASSAANSGHVEIGGNVVAAQTITAMTAAQLAQAVFVAGAAGTTDDIYVQAFDGKAYSGWNDSVHIFV